MGNIYKSKAERLKGDPYIGVCFQALETLEHLCLIQARVNYLQTKTWILTSFCPKQSKGVNRNKRNRYKSLILATIKQEQLILAQGEVSKREQLIYLMQGVVFK